MRNTTDASTADGMNCSGSVRKSSTTSTMAAVVRLASWLRPPAPSTIWVLVGLPLTTKVPLRPAPALARPSPTRSTFSSNGSSYFAAYAREVAALWASTTTKMAPPVPSRPTNCGQVTEGNPKLGRPLGTTPSVATPSAARSSCQLTTIAPTTAMSAPGMRGEMAFDPRITAMTAAETQTVAALLSPRWPTVATNFSTVRPDCVGMPNMPPTCPMATWIPTPVRKPTSTLRERKLAMKPSRAAAPSTR